MLLRHDDRQLRGLARGVRLDDDLRPKFHEQALVVDGFARILAGVLPELAGMEEVTQRSVVFRPAVRVRGGDDDVRDRNAGLFPGQLAGAIREFARHRTEVVANHRYRGVAL